MTAVLVVEDDANLRLTLEDNLEEQGYRVQTASTVKEAEGALAAQPFDVVVLDLMLPDGDGYAVCRSLRARGLSSRVLMLTARSLEEDIVRGFEAGADDYLSKPYRLRELLARVAALARRGAASAGATHRFGAFTLDEATRTVTGPQGALTVTRTEFDLLACLLKADGRVLSRDEILSQVWKDVVVDAHTIDNFVSSLKKKLLVKGKPGFELLTVRGVGYRLVREAAAQSGSKGAAKGV
jgi:DNA-binding response OmpR family regulator